MIQKQNLTCRAKYDSIDVCNIDILCDPLYIVYNADIYSWRGARIMRLPKAYEDLNPSLNITKHQCSTITKQANGKTVIYFNRVEY
jgi:hypothetical protein